MVCVCIHVTMVAGCQVAYVSYMYMYIAFGVLGTNGILTR